MDQPVALRMGGGTVPRNRGWDNTEKQDFPERSTLIHCVVSPGCCRCGVPQAPACSPLAGECCQQIPQCSLSRLLPMWRVPPALACSSLAGECCQQILQLGRVPFTAASSMSPSACLIGGFGQLSPDWPREMSASNKA